MPYVCLHHVGLSSRSLPPSLMDHNLEPQPHDDDKHSATHGHAMPVRTHAFTARGLQSQSSQQVGSEGEPCFACIGSLPSGTVLTCSSASYAPILRRRVLYPAPRVLILRRASYDASYPAPPRPILHRRVLSCTAASYPAPSHPNIARPHTLVASTQPILDRSPILYCDL